MRNLGSQLIFVIVADISEEDECKRGELVQVLYGLNDIRRDLLDNGNIIIVGTKVDRECGLIMNSRIVIDAFRETLLNQYDFF